MLLPPTSWEETMYTIIRIPARGEKMVPLQAAR